MFIPFERKFGDSKCYEISYFANFRNVRKALSLMMKEILYREISFKTLFMSNYSIIHYKVNLILTIKIDTKFVM
jgi:hypothetical protein